MASAETLDINPQQSLEQMAKDKDGRVNGRTSGFYRVLRT